MLRPALGAPPVHRAHGRRCRGSHRLIVTVTPNAAIDRTLRVRRLAAGSLHRVELDHAQAGGKGLNVTRVLREIGQHAHAVVVVGGESGQWILRDLELAGVRASVVHAQGESRTCLEIVDADARVTQFHGAGVAGSSAVADHLVACVRHAAHGAAWLALCGSLPPGMPDDVAARIVEAAREEGARVAVDTSGPALRVLGEARPDLLRVNRAEAEAAGLSLGAGARMCVISDGERDVVAIDGAGRRLRATPPAVALRNPVGCGDAMLAGLLAALSEGSDLGAALRWGLALAGAQAESDWPGHVRVERARALRGGIEIATEPG